MESLKGFGMLGLFLVYLLFQVNSTYAEGIAELKQEEAETIKKIYSNKVVDDSDLVPTRLSFIERGANRLKNCKVLKGVKEGIVKVRAGVRKLGSWIFKPWRSDDHPSEAPQPDPKKKFNELMSKHKSKLKAIFPGTRWCGDGNKASNYGELGLFKHTDACCRQHDNCPLGIGSGKSLGPLLNNAGFTRSWCACDQDFYNCLKAANNPIARKIGVTYFTVLGPQCIDYNYPAKCTNLTSKFDITGRKCLEYEYDQTKEKVLQWKDTPNYVEVLNG
ncbi:phospholipase A(2)-like [Cotesia glomerata]|uniref:Phospholipase A2 n=1 Tax=Cotesia glomerata TaxID=32391 RepID=A0AAV7HU52_COTGL|nr:phospholipase A(2)-like [Cotesia glomerata]KAH0534258.1 hypothetical protein KQX54_002190 [Cotesia glomerata]